MPTDSDSLNDPRRRKGDPPLVPSRETIALIRQILIEGYEQRGAWLTEAEIERAMLKPGL